MAGQSLFPHHVSTMRAIVEAVGVDSLHEIARRPGVRAVYRVAVHHHDGRARDAVGTLTLHATEGALLNVVYRVTFEEKALVHRIEPARLEAFTRVLQLVTFDRLDDQPHIPPYGVDLWMIERAAGSFSRSVIIAPDVAEYPYIALADAVRQNLPQILREVR